VNLFWEGGSVSELAIDYKRAKEKTGNFVAKIAGSILKLSIELSMDEVPFISC
jgi:hypothetical protein